jgi:hypothetical protein
MLDIPAPQEAPIIPVTRVVPLDDIKEEPAPQLPAPREEPQSQPIPDHNGEPRSRGKVYDFFVPAPKEVGGVMSAHSTMRKGEQPLSTSARIAWFIGFALLGGLIGAGIASLFDGRSEFWLLFWPLGLGILGLVIAFYATQFKHFCTYVGREGIARFECSGSRDNLTRQEVFRFRDATEVRTVQTMHYTNGAYTHTSFKWSWNDVGGRTRYVISGTHKSRNGTPPRDSLFHYARAAEVAWTYYLLEQSYRQVRLSGTVLFNLAGGKWIRLGEGVVILGLGGEPIECRSEELAGTSIQQGVVCIRRHDAREGWFSSTGVYKFNFADLANAQLFFHMMEQVVGVRVG